MRLEDIVQSVTQDINCTEYGCCAAVVTEIAKALISQGDRNFKVIEGHVLPEGEEVPVAHTWMVINGQVFDPTAQQFQGQVQYLGPESGEYHEEFMPKQWLQHAAEELGLS